MEIGNKIWKKINALEIWIWKHYCEIQGKPLNEMIRRIFIFGHLMQAVNRSEKLIIIDKSEVVVVEANG